jgi:hypothetical protein
MSRRVLRRRVMAVDDPFSGCESSGSAYDRAVEESGDDELGAWRGSSFPVSPTTAPPPPPPPSSSSSLASISTSKPAWGDPNVNPYAALTPQPTQSQRVWSSDQPQVSAFQQQQGQGQGQGQRRHHHHHHHRHDQDQEPGYGMQQQAPPQPTVNTSWPPPRPANLIPGAPWPPPGAAPGSDLSSFYPAGTIQANPAFWGAAPPATYSPYGTSAAYPYGAPGTSDYYADSSYATMGLVYDSLGRAEIVDMPSGPSGPRRRVVRTSSMGAAAKGSVGHLRAQLRSIGLDLPAKGPVDQRLTDAVNSLFKGWDEAPAGLRAGDMTREGLGKHVALVDKLVGNAIGGAQHLEHAERD